MKSGITYAVVDLETTGTELNGQRRLIQFSCVFLKNHQIINTFNTLVNPQQPLTQEIQQLTKIKPEQLRKAPLFEDVAPTIYALLQNTTFVAHNINFDYNFLNMELERIGYPSLDLAGIDTVQLSQTLLPTLSSFKLNYLSSYLNLTHERPHQADSDAAATAELFLLLQRMIAQLPIPVLKLLCHFRNSFLRQTGDCFVEALQQKKQTAALPSYLIKVENLVLRRSSFQTNEPRTAVYPADDQAKQKLFAGLLDWRQPQAEMMDQLHQALEKRVPKLLVEAPTGLGKTLGYLVPALYEAVHERTCVVSTATTALQNQLVDQVVPLLQQLLPFNFNIAVFKGSFHYLDLAKFSASLKQPQTGQARLLQLRILVWLLATKTGDLAELHLTKYQDPLFEQIRHTGWSGLNPQSVFYPYDFLRRQRQQLTTADLVVTNHAYLLQHAAELGNQQRFLIIDEAQHLNQTALLASQRQLDFDQIKIQSDTLLVMMQSQQSFSLKDLLAQGLLPVQQAHKLIRLVRLIDQRVPEIRGKIIERFILPAKPTAAIFEDFISLKDIYGFIKENINDFQAVAAAGEQLLELFLKLQAKFKTPAFRQRLDTTASNFVADLSDWLTQLLQELTAWQYFDLPQVESWGTSGYLKLRLPLTHQTAHLHALFGAFQTADFLESQVYQNFAQTIFIGASLTLPGKHQQFIYQQLDLPATTPFVKLPDLFDYRQQALALIGNDGPDVVSQRAAYLQYLIKTLTQILLAAPAKQTMILFNSQAALETVYQALQDNGVGFKRHLLAQGITGSNEKIIKNFTLGSKMVLLGTGTFWEGIDLPQDQLEQLIIAQLPFSSPDTPLNQLRFKQLRQQQQSAFWDYSLPEAMQRLQQGVGRLIRTPNDHGVVIILDSRIVTRKYGQQLQQALPQSMPLQILKTDQISKELAKFW
jgi:ATP-dependent DNA helicase DinG